MRHEFTFTIYNGDCAVDTQQTNGDLVTFDMYDDGYVGRCREADGMTHIVHTTPKCVNRRWYLVDAVGRRYVRLASRPYEMPNGDSNGAANVRPRRAQFIAEPSPHLALVRGEP